MPRQTQQERSSAGECRQCRTFCDKLVNPAGCLEMGCMYKVFSAEIDFDLFLLAERTREGFGGIKMTGTPLPHCEFSVERAYEGSGPGHECVNRRFFDAPDDHPESIQAFDLRNSIT